MQQNPHSTQIQFNWFSFSVRVIMHTRTRWPLALLLLIMLIAFWPYVSAPFEIPFSRSSDLIRHYLPFKEVLFRQFQETGSLPLWDPHTLGGHPLAADPGYGAFYPLGIFFYSSPPEQVFSLFFFFHALLGALLTYRLLRAHSVSAEASAFGALAYSLNLKLMTTFYAGFATMIPAQAWLPGAFLAVQSFRKASTWPRRALATVGLALILALQLLAGDAQLMLYTVTLLIPYALFVPTCPLPNRTPRRLVTLAAILAAIGLTTLLAWPMVQMAARLTEMSTRANGVPYAISTLMSLPPSHLPAMIVPALSGSDADLTYRGPEGFWELSFYPGLWVWFLALAILGRYRQDRRILPLALLSYLALLMAFGKYTPVHTLLYYLAPGFDHFRAPARVLPLLGLFMAQLGASGLDAFVREDAEGYRRAIRGSAWVGAGLCILAIASLLYFKSELIPVLQEYIHAQIHLEASGEQSYQGLLRGFTVAALLLALLSYLARSPWILQKQGLQFKQLSLLVLGLDLLFNSRGLIQTAAPEEVFPPHPLAEKLSAGSVALDTGDRAVGAGSEALDTRDKALSTGNDVLDTRDKALSTGNDVLDTEDKALGAGSEAFDTEDKALGAGSEAFDAAVVRQSRPRILDLSGALPDAVAVHYNLRILNGMNPLVMSLPYVFSRHLQGDPAEVPQDRTVYGALIFEVKHPRLLDLLRVAEVISHRPIELPGFSLREALNDTVVFQQFRGMVTYPKLYRYSRNALQPEAWVVPAARVEPENAGEALQLLERKDPFQGTTLWVSTDGPQIPAELSSRPWPDRDPDSFAATSQVIDPAAIATVESWSPSRITLSAKAPKGGGVLVLSEIYARGWQATIDGRSANVWCADYLLRAVLLEQGSHVVEWQYHP